MAEVYVDLDRFRTLVEARFGIVLDGDPAHFVRMIRERMKANGCHDFSSYASLLEGDAEARLVADLLTVGETYFFRNADHFRALVERALPARLRATSARPIRILCVGCASGEEPYTIAILLHEHFSHLDPREVSVHGIDVSRAAIRRAEKARFTTWSLRGTPPVMRTKYFQPEGSELRLRDEIRSRVSFEERNLFGDDPMFWAPSAFDIVLCRNVVIYFAPQKVDEAIARLTAVLAPGGYLFLGHSESLRGMTDDFDVLQTHETFYYRRREPRAVAPAGGSDAPTRARPTSRPPPSFAPDPLVRTTEPIEEEVARRSEAIVGLATELYRQEHFQQALDLLGSVSASETEPTALLLSAAILTNQGRLADAEAICQRVLVADDLNAGAHYLTALVRERAGDVEGAVRHDQAAAYLDPTFAMPRLHLGMIARHGGDLENARRELAIAASLLPLEAAGRIVLFGGGFGRDALLRLCRAELEAAGGSHE